jgi:hypothetical protein
MFDWIRCANKDDDLRAINFGEGAQPRQLNRLTRPLSFSERLLQFNRFACLK